MSYQIDKSDSFTVVQLQTDRLDAQVAPSLKSEFVVMNGEGVKNIIVDLNNAKYCDSSGLSSILIANRLCKGSNGRLIICNLQESVHKIISISQLDSVISIASSLDEAKMLIQQ